MADVIPDQRVGQQKLRASIAQQEAQIASQVLAILEMAEKRESHLRNIAASRAAIEKLKADLRAMEQAHGPLTDEMVQHMIKSLEA